MNSASFPNLITLLQLPYQRRARSSWTDYPSSYDLTKFISPDWLTQEIFIMFRVAIRAAGWRAAGASRSIHVSAQRGNLLQNLYIKEVQEFKPKKLTEKDAEGSVLQWAAPAAPKIPSVEGDVSEVDAYAKETVEVDSAPATSDSTSAGEVQGDDWFPLEEIKEDH